MCFVVVFVFPFFFFKQKTAYEMRISDWSSDVCSSDLGGAVGPAGERGGNMFDRLWRLASASHLLGNRISRRLDEIRRRPGRHKVVLRQSSILSSRDRKSVV